MRDVSSDEHIQGFTPSHRMPSLVECMHLIIPVNAMVDKSKYKPQNTTETQLLASNYGTF